MTIAPIAATLVIVAAQWVFAFETHTELLAALLLLAYVPPHLHHVWAAAHARRPAAGGWTLAAMAVVFVAGMVLVGPQWYLSAAQLLVSVLIVLRLPWSVVAGVVIVAGTALTDQFVAPAPAPLWVGLVILERAGATLVPAWFAGALRQLRVARAEMAEQAVAAERRRIDEQLAGTVGAELRAIVARAEALTDPATVERDLRALVDSSRRTLADARRLLRSFQRVPLRVELNTAVALLEAAGVRATLTLPRGELGESDELALALRSAVDQVLHNDSARACVITVAREAGRLRLAVAVDGVPVATSEAAA